jgi:hypothetical protein
MKIFIFKIIFYYLLYYSQIKNWNSEKIRIDSNLILQNILNSKKNYCLQKQNSCYHIFKNFGKSVFHRLKKKKNIFFKKII